jgi:beta-ureidopropionase / N-carbamoyl-L-amino-acid hydrolase
MNDVSSLRIDGKRLWDSLMELARIGATAKGGVCRLALTDLDKEGRDLVVGWAKQAGMTITTDKIGNVFMRRKGKNDALPPIMCGSHIDTQPTGGKFDGNYGVLAGIEVVRTLNDRGVETEAPIEVAFWTNEEGSRFVPVMMGSGVFAGAFSLETAYAAKDTAGKTVKDELERIGYVGDEEPGKHPIGAYFEAHIEQGPCSKTPTRPSASSPGVLGLRWYDCVVSGMEAHAGPTPMALRKDALQVATRIMQETVAIALRYPPYGRGTVGFVQVHPNSRNVIPGQVKFSIDLRNVDSERLDKMDAEIRAFVEQTSKETGLPSRSSRSRTSRRAPSRRAASTPCATAPRPRATRRWRRSRRRPRRGLHGPPRARRHGLRPLQGRHQPQRDRRREARAPRGRLQRAAARDARPRQGRGLSEWRRRAPRVGSAPSRVSAVGAQRITAAR